MIYIGDNDIAKSADIHFYGVKWGSFTEKINFINYCDFKYSKKK